jgi:hypothetical protein
VVRATLFSGAHANHTTLNPPGPWRLGDAPRGYLTVVEWVPQRWSLCGGFFLPSPARPPAGRINHSKVQDRQGEEVRLRGRYILGTWGATTPVPSSSSSADPIGVDRLAMIGQVGGAHGKVTGLAGHLRCERARRGGMGRREQNVGTRVDRACLGGKGGGGRSFLVFLGQEDGR